MPRAAFVLKIQRELGHLKCARKVSGLSRNGPQAPVVQSLDSTIRWITQEVLVVLIQWIAIHGKGRRGDKMIWERSKCTKQLVRGGGETHDWKEGDGHKMNGRGEGNKMVAGRAKARNVWEGMGKQREEMIGSSGGGWDTK